VITFLGLTRSDDSLLPPSGTTPDGVPFYQRVAGIAFSIVVEGKPGPNGVAVGRSSYQQDGSSFPDLEIAVSRPLGNGSAAVCDNAGATAGGVPAINPPQFDPKPATINAVNDFACRFVDGGGAPVARKPTEACVLFSTGAVAFGIVSLITRPFAPAAQRAGALVARRQSRFPGAIDRPSGIIIRRNARRLSSKIACCTVKKGAAVRRRAVVILSTPR